MARARYAILSLLAVGCGDRVPEEPPSQQPEITPVTPSRPEITPVTPLWDDEPPPPVSEPYSPDAQEELAWEAFAGKMTVDPSGCLNLSVDLRAEGWAVDGVAKEPDDAVPIPVNRIVKMKLKADRDLEFSIPTLRLRRSVSPSEGGTAWFCCNKAGNYPVFVVVDGTSRKVGCLRATDAK